MNSDLLVRSSQFEWQSALGGWWLFAALLVLLAAFFLSVFGYFSLPPRRRALLLALRLSALGVLAVVLFGPVEVHSEGQQRLQPLAVLVDGSRSMSTEDVQGVSRSEAVSAWLADRREELAKLADDYRLRFFLIDEGLRPWNAEGRPAAKAASTDLGKGLLALTEALGGEQPAGVLLLSDGADRSTLIRALSSGGSAAVEDLVADLDFPVSTWTLGDSAGPPDLGVELSLPPFGFVRRPLNVEVHLSSRSLPGDDVEVLLREDGEIVAARNIARVEGRQSLRFEVKPDRVGFHTYRVEIPRLKGDTVVENNVSEATVKVIRDRTRVLQVTSRPSWDVKFLRRLLKTDPNIDLVSFFILRNSDRRGALTRSGGLSLIAFPYEELFSEDLQGFDLVIFQDFWFGSFTHLPPDSFLVNLAEYVREGGAFLMIGGDTSFGEGDYAGSALDEVMPTRVPASSFVYETFSAELTDAGRRHPITRLDQVDERNVPRWSSLSPLEGRNPLGPLRKDAVALLSAGARGPVLAAVRQVDRGRTMSFASDQSWRWGMSTASETDAGRVHASFWRNAIRWLVKDAREAQVQVLLDRENYEVGDEVQVQVRVLGADYSPRSGVSITGTIGKLNGAPWQNIAAVTDRAGQATLSTQASAKGVMVVRVEGEEAPASLGYAEARASVSDRRGELQDPRANPTLMRALAEGSGGIFLEGENPDPTLMKRNPATKLLAMDRTVTPLWNRWWLLLLIVFPLAGEWTLRRRLGLR